MKIMKKIRHKWKWLVAEFRWRFLGKRYEVSMSEQAEEDLENLPPEVRDEVLELIERLKKNPYIGERVE